MPQLSQRHCEAMKAGVAPLERARAEQMLSEVKGWALSEDAKELSQTFKFKNYYETMAFVNAVAWIAHREDHHPDIEVGYNRCQIRYSTHSIGGLSANDFICAARIDTLLD